MTGATAIQTNILAWLTPVAIILVMVLGAMAMANRVHAPRPGSDQRNYHAHLLSTTREATVAGLGRKSNAELNDTDRSQRGLPRSRDEFKFLRERWATLTNQALRDAGLEVRVDHRSLEAQGVDREPTPRIPIGALRLERLGLRSEIADRIRVRHRDRVAARAERRTLAAKREAQAAAQYQAPTTKRDATLMTDQAWGVDGRRGPSLEEVRRHAREAWVEFRAKAVDEATAQKAMTLEKVSAVAAKRYGVDAPERESRLPTGAALDAAF